MADVQGVSAERLKQYIERIERLEEDKSGISDDIKDVYAEAKSTGFDAKIMKMIVRLRKMASDKRRERKKCSTFISPLSVWNREINRVRKN